MAALISSADRPAHRVGGKSPQRAWSVEGACNARRQPDLRKRLHDRIVQRRAHEIAQQHAAIERQRLLWGGVAVLLVAAVSIVAYRQWQRRSVVRQQYDNRLKEAELLFQQVAVNMPLGGLSLQEITPAHVDGAPHDMASAFLQLEGELRRCQQRSGTTLTDVDRLIADLQKLNKQLGPT